MALSLVDIKRWGMLRKGALVAAMDAALGSAAWRSEAAGSGLSVNDGAVTTPWRLSGTYTKGSFTLSGPLPITVDQTASIDGGSTTAIIVADGINVPTVGGIALSPWTNVASTAHQVIVKREGSVITVHVGPAALSIPLAVPAAPTAGKPVITGSPSTSAPLAWTAGAITGVPSPTVIYALVDSSNTVLQDNIVSGAYTRTTAATGAKIRVTLVNSEGSAVNYSDPFNITAITTPDAPTWAATPFTAIGAAGWTANLVAPASNGGSAVTDYKVRIKPSSSSTWTEYSDAVSAALTIAVTGQAAATQFDVQAAALNGIGWSGWSGTATVTTTAASTVSPLDAAEWSNFGSASGLTNPVALNTGLQVNMLRTSAAAFTGDFEVVNTAAAAPMNGVILVLNVLDSGGNQVFDIQARSNGDLMSTGQVTVSASGANGVRVTRVGAIARRYYTTNFGTSWTQFGPDVTDSGARRPQVLTGGTITGPVNLNIWSAT